MPCGGGVTRRRGQGLAAGGTGRDHRFSRRSREILRLLADIGASPRAAAVKAAAQRKRARRGASDSRRGAERPRALSAPPRRRRLRCIDGAAVALRAGRGVGDPRRGRGAGPRSDATGDRRRGRVDPARQERPRDRSGPVSLGGARQRALRTTPLPCHVAAAARGASLAGAVRARWQGEARRRIGSPRRQGRGGDAGQSAFSQCGRPDLARRRGNLRRSRAARSHDRDRGHAFADDAAPDEFGGNTIEKPWIAAVEAFAIGGHCQVLLVMDYVLAERSAFLTLPARKEGIIPGAANMRMPRFTGDRIARQAVQYERRIECDSPEGRLICDEIVETGEMDAAIERVVEGLTSSGVVSAASNRRAFRIAQEPLEMFRAYFAVYAREQAYCHFSPALIANLERYWNAQSRKP